MKNQGENLRRDDSSIPLKKNKPTPVYLGYRLIIRGVLYLDVQSRRGCARILLEGMLVLGRYDADLMQALLPYEIMIYARDEVLLLEVWVEFWDIA